MKADDLFEDFNLNIDDNIPDALAFLETKIGDLEEMYITNDDKVDSFVENNSESDYYSLSNVESLRDELEKAQNVFREGVSAAWCQCDTWGEVVIELATKYLDMKEFVEKLPEE